MKVGMLTATALFGALLMLGCGPPPEDPAVTAFKQFDRAIRYGDAPQLWGALSRDSQDELRRRLDLPGDAEDADVLERLGVRPHWPFELELPPRVKPDPGQTSEDRRVLVAKYGSKVWRVTMRRSSEGWRVDLFAPTTPSGR